MVRNRLMLRLSSILLAGLTVPALSQSNQSADAHPAIPTAASESGDGVPILVELSKTLNAKKAKVGDQVKAEVVQDVLFHGKILVRRGSKLIGHVTEAKPRTTEDAESRLGMIFDKALLKRGKELGLNGAGIQALAAATRLSPVDQPDQMLPPSFGGGGMSQGSTISPMGDIPRGRGSGPPVMVPPTISNSEITNQRLKPEPEQQRFTGSVLSGGSRGVFGIPGLKLVYDKNRNAEKTVVVSTHDNVKLESGVQVLVQVTAPLAQ